MKATHVGFGGLVTPAWATTAAMVDTGDTDYDIF